MDKQDAEDRANDDRYDERLMVHAELAAEILHKDAEIARLKAALEVERAACDRFYAAGTKTWRAGVDLTKTIHAESFWTAWDAHHAVRASDRNDEG